MVKLVTPEHFLMDKRNLERREIAHTLKQKEFESYLKNLPDSAEEAEHIPIWENENTLPSRRVRKLIAQEKRARENASHAAQTSEATNIEAEDAANGAAAETPEA